MLMLACPGHALAQAEPAPASAPPAPAPPAPAPPASVSTAPAAPGAPAADGVFSASRTNLLGTAWGARPALDALGITVNLQDISEVFANATGGLHRGAAFDGATELSVGVDTAKLFGLAGGTLNISAYQIHGRDLSTDDLSNLQASSGIAAERATRLWEMWFQQSLLGGKLSVKVGQQSLDQEFTVSTGSALFVNAAMGWPQLAASDMYGGGPAYPLASLGVRVQVQPTGALTILGGVFDDNPAGGTLADDSQTQGGAQSGTAFNLRTGALAIGEVQYAIDTLALLNGSAANTGQKAVFKIGGWYDSGHFADQRYDATGLSLADPHGTGTPRQRVGDWSLYGVVDQPLWQQSPSGARALAAFARIMVAPSGRNLISASFNAGFTLKMPLPGRDHDTLGLGYGLAKVSGSAAGLDADQAIFGQAPRRVRGSESFVELTYQAQIFPWLSVQPDAQYVFAPGGGVADGTRRLRNEAVFGVRLTTLF